MHYCFPIFSAEKTEALTNQIAHPNYMTRKEENHDLNREVWIQTLLLLPHYIAAYAGTWRSSLHSHAFSTCTRHYGQRRESWDHESSVLKISCSITHRSYWTLQHGHKIVGCHEQDQNWYILNIFIDFSWYEHVGPEIDEIRPSIIVKIIST